MKLVLVLTVIFAGVFAQAAPLYQGDFQFKAATAISDKAEQSSVQAVFDAFAEYAVENETLVATVKNGAFSVKNYADVGAMKILEQVVKSGRCEYNEEANGACLISGFTGAMYNLYVKTDGDTQYVYTSSFPYESYPSHDGPHTDLAANLNRANSAMPVVYTLNKGKGAADAYICAVSANLAGGSFHIVVGGQSYEGYGYMYCRGVFTGTVESQMVKIELEGVGLGLGAATVDNMWFGLGEVALANGMDSLMGTYGAVDANVQLGPVGLGLGAGVLLKSDALAVTAFLGFREGMGLAASVNINKLKISKAN